MGNDGNSKGEALAGIEAYFKSLIATAHEQIDKMIPEEARLTIVVRMPIGMTAKGPEFLEMVLSNDEDPNALRVLFEAGTEEIETKIAAQRASEGAQ